MTTILAATRPVETVEALVAWGERVGVETAERIRTQSADRGTLLHQLVEQYLLGEPVDRALIAEVRPWWLSIEPVLQRISEIKLMEMPVYHPLLGYAGTPDLVANFSLGTANQRLTLVDWKSADKEKRADWLSDYPIQLAAYCGALRQTHSLRIEQGMIVLAHPLGPAQVFRFDRQQLSTHWQAWLKRLQQFWQMSEGHPLAADVLHYLSLMSVKRLYTNNPLEGKEE
ncbi:MAG: PD-(D/E)XK nuclease family protein [Anaerolineae bacterium]|nr:PD-(D/E)XK nuclease family protein [Gloeobacterales cyanobacterium ES-bin-313]